MYAEHLRQLGFRPHHYRSKRLKNYYSRMSKSNDNVLFDRNVAAMLEAQGYSIEETPRSVYDVDKLYEALEGYAPRNHQRIKPNQDFDAGLALAYACFAKPKLSHYLEPLPMTPETIIMVTSNPRGSAGLTNYGYKKADSETRALERGLQTIKKEKAPEPCLAFSRTQFNMKTRLVWGYPYSMTVLEGLFAYPLLQWLKRGTTPMAFAMTTLVLGSSLRISSYHREWAYCLDMSQYDATISAFLIRKAFKVIKTWFDLTEIEPTSGMKYSQIFEIVEDYFIKTPIVMPDGNVYYGKDHGVPSGSFFTQIVDSIVNVIIIGSIANHFDLHVSSDDLYALGDDSVFFSNHLVSLDAISSYALRSLGIRIHGSDKSAVVRYDQPIHFLGRVWVNGLPTLDVKEIIARAVYPERVRIRSKDLEKRQREVDLLLLSMAANYIEGWELAAKALGLMNSNVHRGIAPLAIMLQGGSIEDLNPDHLSGLLRYQLKFGNRNKSYTDVALQFWA